MKNIIACVLLGLSGSALAMDSTAFTCSSEDSEYWQSEADILQLAHDMGYPVEYLEVTPGNCYAGSVADENGAITELFFDPVSGAIMHTNYVNQ